VLSAAFCVVDELTFTAMLCSVLPIGEVIGIRVDSTPYRSIRSRVGLWACIPTRRSLKRLRSGAVRVEQ